MQREIGLSQLSYAPIDLWGVKMLINKFYTIASRYKDTGSEPDVDFDVTIMKYQQANLIFSKVKNTLRNLLKPEDNEYIKEHRTSFNWMIDNLGRVDKKLGELQEMVISKGDQRVIISRLKLRNSLIIYYNYLCEAMQILIIETLLKAYNNFSEYPNKIKIKDKKTEKVEEREVIKDKSLFIYLLFLEMYHASFSLGAITREEVKMVKGTTSSIQPISEISPPPRIPTNIRTASSIDAAESTVEGEPEMTEQEFEL